MTTKAEAGAVGGAKRGWGYADRSKALEAMRAKAPGRAGYTFMSEATGKFNWCLDGSDIAAIVTGARPPKRLRPKDVERVEPVEGISD